LALGVDLAAEQARHLVRDGTDVDGSVPDGDGPARLLSPAELVPTSRADRRLRRFS
jgi:hypothetical protein